MRCSEVESVEELEDLGEVGRCVRVGVEEERPLERRGQHPDHLGAVAVGLGQRHDLVEACRPALVGRDRNRDAGRDRAHRAGRGLRRLQVAVSTRDVENPLGHRSSLCGLADPAQRLDPVGELRAHWEVDSARAHEALQECRSLLGERILRERPL